MTDSPFRSDQVTLHIELPLPNWNAEPPPQPNGDLVSIKSPRQLPSSDEKRDAELAATKVMIPYGATYLRLTTLPIVEAQ